MSTFCRECGEHFRIKNGEAVSSLGANVSGLTSFRELGEVEAVADTPLDRRNRAIDIQPASEKVKVEFEEPFSGSKKDSATSETDVSETGAETWLETARKTSLEVKKTVFDPTPSVEETVAEKPVTEPEQVPPLEKKKEKKALKSSKKVQPESSLAEEPVTNPIALAAAEANEKDKAVRELEAAQLEENQAQGDSDSSLGASAQPKEVLAGGSMGALLGGISTDADVAMSADSVVIEPEEAEEEEAEEVNLADQAGELPSPAKMPVDYAAPSKKNQDPNSRPIRCFKCNHQQMVSLSASSTQCGRCSVYISLSDYDIKSSQSQTIRTRGNVTIHRRGSLVGCDIACHDLIVLGKLSGSVDCSGNATFKNSGKVIGSMHCKHLQVDKKCELTFPHGVIAESADIHGIVNGNITCSGTVKILKTGAVNGDATAKAIVLKDGGILSGQMSIQHDVDIELPVKRGYDPSVIR